MNDDGPAGRTCQGRRRNRRASPGVPLTVDETVPADVAGNVAGDGFDALLPDPDLQDQQPTLADRYEPGVWSWTNDYGVRDALLIPHSGMVQILWTIAGFIAATAIAR